MFEKTKGKTINRQIKVYLKIERIFFPTTSFLLLLMVLLRNFSKKVFNVIYEKFTNYLTLITFSVGS